MTDVRITKDCQVEGNYLFWTGEVFGAMSGPPFDTGVEVKTAGDYVWLPAGVFEVVT